MVLNSTKFGEYPGFMSDDQSDVARRGKDLSMEVRNRSVEHNLSHDRYRRLSRVVSIVGALLAATAGASLATGLTGGWAKVVAGLGLLSALLAAVEPYSDMRSRLKSTGLLGVPLERWELPTSICNF
jgi:hypothetical protein